MRFGAVAPCGVPRRAWVVRAMFALALLGILSASAHHILQQQVEEGWRRFSEEFRRAPLPETRRAIDERFDDAFAPVYARIPALLDWHSWPQNPSAASRLPSRGDDRTLGAGDPPHRGTMPGSRESRADVDSGTGRRPVSALPVFRGVQGCQPGGPRGRGPVTGVGTLAAMLFASADTRSEVVRETRPKYGCWRSPVPERGI